MYQDETLNCVDCSASFPFTASQQQFFADKGFTNKPSRCPNCRDARKAQRGASGGGGRSGGFGGGEPRETFPAVCAACNKPTELPFKPRNDRPVYCRECFATRQPAR